MKNSKLLVCTLTAVLLLTVFLGILPILASQPPLKTDTFYVGTIGQPLNVDPSQGYDTASGELIMNVYDSMIQFSDKVIVPVPANNSLDIGTRVSDLSADKVMPGLCGLPEVVAVTGSGSNWTFPINTNIIYQPWQDHLGVWHVGEHLSVDDIIYFFDRTVVFDSHNSPEWIWMGPAFGVGNWDDFDADPSTNAIEPLKNDTAGERLVTAMIEPWVTDASNSSGAYVKFDFKYDYPSGALYNIFCQTWAMVPPKDFSIEHGCWNGTFYDGWSADYRRFPNDSFTPLDTHTDKSKYSYNAEPAMCGTGPYNLTYWNQAVNEWRIDKFAECVLHPWPGPYGASNPAPTTVIVTGVNTWPTRKMMFLDGTFDFCVVNRANMYDLLTTTPGPLQRYTPIPGIQLYYDIPQLETDAVFYILRMNPGSKWIPTVGYTNGTTRAEPNIFNDKNFRLGMVHALNFTQYISGAWYGEAVHPATWWCTGLTPKAAFDPALVPYDKDIPTMYHYIHDVAGVRTLSITFLYNIGNDQRMIAAQLMATTMAELTAYARTTGGDPQANYVASVVGEDWPSYLVDQHSFNLPFHITGWTADFADADDFAVPFMASYGTFAGRQRYSNSTVDDLITLEETTSDPTARNGYLKQLQDIYYQDAIALPTVAPTGRHWQRDWVFGYYINQLAAGTWGGYYQDYYKKAPQTYEPVDVDITHSITATVSYPQVYIFQGAMNIMYGGGVPATMTFTIHVARADSNTAVPALPALVALQRYNLTNFNDATTPALLLSGTLEYPNSTLVILPPGGGATVTLQWYEGPGALITLPANVTWQPGAFAGLMPGSGASDSNTADKTVNAAFNVTAYTTTTATGYFSLVGDINGDATVDILDAIKLANSFGLTSSQAGFNKAADINSDGTVNILDAILLANHFNVKLVYTTLGP